MLLKSKITFMLMVLVNISLGNRIHDKGTSSELEIDESTLIDPPDASFGESDSTEVTSESSSVTDYFQDANYFFETESEKKSRSSNESDNFQDARDSFETESWEPVTLQASETSSTTTVVAPNSVREGKTSDCPLQEGKAQTNAKEMRVHVLPRKVPFNVNIQLNVETRISSHEKSISLSSKKLKIEVGKWSHFTVKAHKQGFPERWKVTVHRDGAMEGFQSIYFGIITYFKNLVVNIPTRNISWYVGPKNLNCDALISTTTASSTTPAPTTTTTITTTTTTSTQMTTSVGSTADALSVSQVPLQNEGKMNNCFNVL